MLSKNQKQEKKKLGKKAGPTPTPSALIVKRYLDGMGDISNEQINEFNYELFKALGENKSPLEIQEILSKLSLKWNKINQAYSKQLVTSIAIELTRNTLKSWDKLVKSDQVFEKKKFVSIGIGNIYTSPELKNVVLASVANNINLIRKTSNGISEQIGNKVTQILTALPNETGISLKIEIDKILKKTGEYSAHRAKLIATDQTRKMVRSVSRHRAMELGIEEYQWATLNDSRVRDKHTKLNKRIFKYSIGAPPSYATMPIIGVGFHPGQDISCRCIEIPIIPPIKQI